jgi:hypothetical protein
MISRIATCVVAAAVLLALTTAHGQASVAPHANRLTFRTAVTLPGVTLPAGSYVFERALPNTMNLIRVTNAAGSQVYFMAFTEVVDRPVSLRPNQLVTFGEARLGRPTPIEAWYPLGEPKGHRFIY